jgi:hypothetical protein
LFAYSGDQHILCCVFLHHMLPVSLDCPYAFIECFGIIHIRQFIPTIIDLFNCFRTLVTSQHFQLKRLKARIWVFVHLKTQFYATFMIANLQFRDIWILKSLSCCLYEKQYGADLFDIFFIIIVIPALILYIYIVAFSDSWQLPKYIFNTFLNVYIVLFLFFAESLINLFLFLFHTGTDRCPFKIQLNPKLHSRFLQLKTRFY